jgi:hypothetical protein
MNDGELYVCQSCGHENHADSFAKMCLATGINLDELEAELAAIPMRDTHKGRPS